MANFQNLRVLDLYNVGISGNMAEDVDLSGSVKTLTWLNLGSWRGSETEAGVANDAVPTWMANFSFKVLALRDSKFTFDLAKLDLRGSQDTLHTLALHTNAFAAGPVPTWLGSFTKMRSLYLGNTNRNGYMSHVGKVLEASSSTLTKLYLNDNPGFVPGPVPAWLFQFKSLDPKTVYYIMANTRRYHDGQPTAIVSAVLKQEAPTCPEDYEGDRCQTCKGCADGLTCAPLKPLLRGILPTVSSTLEYFGHGGETQFHPRYVAITP